MIGRLISALGAVDPQPTAEEIADAVWLADVRARLAAEHTRTQKPPGAAPDAPAVAGVPATPAPGGRPADATRPQAPPRPGESPRPPRETAEPPVSLHPPPRGASSAARPGGVPVRSPAAPAVPGTLAIARSLRPLHRRADARGELVLDEDATVTATADTGVWLPQQRPASSRWLDLMLIVDVSGSMLAWERTVAEFRRLLERLGAFRDVRLWRVDSDRDAVALPTLHSESDVVGGTGRHPGELVDPSGRRAFLLVSDCIGAAWDGGGMARLLELWGRTGPVAVVQPLPQRLWTYCPPTFLPVRLRGPRPGAANAELRHAPRQPDTDVPSGLAVPVMELDARWLASWAALVAGSPGWIHGVALFTGLPGSAHVGGLADADGRSAPPRGPLERIQRFRATMSPAAWQLAGYLSAAPLSPPVMRLVQRVMLPASSPAVLAETLLGGLIRQDGPNPAASDGAADFVTYEFHDGVRGLLQTGLRRSDALCVLSEVGAFISARLGSPMDFRALLSAGHPGTQQSESPVLEASFATITDAVFRSMGGYYAELAELVRRSASENSAASADQSAANEVAAKPVRQHWPAATTQPPTPYPQRGNQINSGDHVITSGLEARRAEEQRAATPPAVSRGVPPKNPHFTGREELLERLHATLSGRVTAVLPQALHGYGGVGKSQLAVEYCHRFATEYDLICWIPAEQPALIRSSLVELASALGVPQGPDVTHTMNAVIDALRQGMPYRRWLLVFDNADQPEEITDFFPYASGHIIVTSRNPRWSGVAGTLLEIDVFARSESVGFLQRRVPTIPTAEADRLADRLGDLPLALEQAAAWQVESGMSIDEFLRLFEENDANLSQLLGSDLPVGYPRPVAATWNVALAALHDQSPAAVQLLELCAFFGSETIPYSVLWAGRNAPLPAPLNKTIKNSIELRRDIRRISRYALARVNPATSNIQVHRLVQTLLRARLDKQQRDATQSNAHQLLAQANPNAPDDTRNWPLYADLLPHIRPSGAVEGSSDEIRLLVLDEVRYLYRLGDYESSRDLAEQARAVWLDRYGADDEQALVMARHLATSVRALGGIERAGELNEETLDRMQQRHGQNHEHSLVTANSHGADLRFRGQFLEALALDEDTLERTRQVFGEDEPQTLRVANNLAVDLRLLGRFTEAHTLDDDTWHRRRQVLRDDDTEILASIGNLARDLVGLGRYEEARAKVGEDLERFVRLVGSSDTDVIETRRTQAVILRKLGQREEAWRLATQNLNAYERRLGARHPLTIGAMASLTNDLRVVGRLDEAREKGETAKELYQSVLGENHPFTHVCASNLAIVYRALGRPNAARELDGPALDALRRLLGERHIYTLCVAANMANNLHLTGEHEAARDLSERTYERSVEVRGRDHLYTLACAVNLSIDLGHTGQEERARQLREHALAGYRQTLGEHHPATVAVSGGRRTEADIEPPAM